MKKFLNSKYGDAIILSAATLLAVIFTIIFYSVKLLPFSGGTSLWNTSVLITDEYIIEKFSTWFIIAFFVGLALFILSVLLVFLKRKKLPFYFALGYNIILNLVILFIHVGLNFLRPAAIACSVISIILSTAAIAYMIIRRVMTKDFDSGKTDGADGYFKPQPELKPKTVLAFKIVLLACEVLTTILAFIVFFIPLYSKPDLLSSISFAKEDITLISVLKSAFSGEDFPVALYIAFLVMFIAFFASLLNLVSNVSYFFKSDSDFVKKSKQYIYSNVAFLLVFFVLGFGFAFYENLTDANGATTLSYVPMLCALPILVAFSVIQGKLGYGIDGENIKNTRKLSIEPLIYVILLTAITFLSLLLNIVEIHIKIAIFENDVVLTGYKLLETYAELGSGLQALAFVLFAVLLVSGILLVFSLVSYFTKYKDYGKVIKTTAITNAAFVLIIGLSGVYFKIAQAINIENINSILALYDVELLNGYVYTMSSKAIYMFIASFAVLLVMLIRGQLSPEKAQTAPLEEPADETDPYDGNGDIVNETEETNFEEKTLPTPATTAAADFDACPAFTELDFKRAEYDAALATRRENLFENLTLPNLVRFVVDYARECRLHLSYSLEDMATFVAGLGASRLTILQGMSGTGKTSLPKIFAEAVMGNCEIVEVESSWRDKNELLGYYNEFSKCFTPKKFTQCLYKAKLNPTVPTFIVLDEMNLSRIEYYFSDFLSLMEHEEDKREIKLLNVKLFRTVNGEKYEYSALTDGHTIKIPANIWFIGTANRDESTFVISDKVYDRAQTMNFDKRAPKIHSFGEPLAQRFAPYGEICRLFEKAKISFSFDAEGNAIIQKVEKLLIPFNISFGNRILRQMEDFVKIYCACFGDRDAVLKEAVEKILLSKVVCKLEYKVVENKDGLAAEFDKLGLAACSAFIRRLNED